MFDFALITGERARQPLAHDLAAFAACEPEQVLRYSVGRGDRAVSVAAFYWESHPVHRLSDRLRIDANGFACLAGYALDENMKPLRTVDRFDPDRAGDYDGDFLYLSVSETGDCRVVKSPVCSYPLYHARGDGRDVLASRAMLAAVAAFDTDKPPPNIDFARWICTYGGAGNSEALFTGVRNIFFNQDIRIRDGCVNVGDQDHLFLADDVLERLYARSPKAYWDDVYDYLRDLMSILDFSDEAIDFPLSGGRDSRLLLALIAASGARDRLARVFTNGPAISPDVRSAQLVCEALGLPHDFVDSVGSGRKTRFTMDDKILGHIRVTEGEMSPHDPTYGGKPARRVQLLGIESGLRNVSGLRNLPDRDRLFAWYRVHLAHGDKCGLFRTPNAQRNLEDAEHFLDMALQAGVPPEQVPVLYRMVPRSARWVSRAWRAYNDRFFAPAIFANINLYRATYNCGAAARGREEFHFEMLRRAAPNLMEVPFAGQRWNDTLLENAGMAGAEPLDWPEGTRPETTKATQEVLYRAFPRVKEFLLRHEGPVSDLLLDRGRLARFSLNDAHPSVFMSFWNFILIAALELAPSLEALTSGLSGPDVGLPSFDL